MTAVGSLEAGSPLQEPLLAPGSPRIRARRGSGVSILDDLSDGSAGDQDSECGYVATTAKASRKNHCKIWMTRLWKRFTRVFPILRWLPKYNLKEYLLGDIIAGLTVGLLVIPQSTAYAKIAEVGPECGLYSALLAPILYTFLGSSRQIAVGPGPVVALLTKKVVADLMDHEKQDCSSPFMGDNCVISDVDRMNIIYQLTFLVGVIQLVVGALQSGVLVGLVPRPVFSGIMAATALTVCVYYIELYFGIPHSHGKYYFDSMWEILLNMRHVPKTWINTCVSTLGLIVFALFKFKLKKIGAKGALVAVFLFALFSWAVDLEKNHVMVIGKIPKGLPTLINVFDLIKVKTYVKFRLLLLPAIQVVLAGYIESISATKQLATSFGYIDEIDPSQEFVALGVANILGPFIGAFPVNGVLSRSSVAAAAGAKSPLYSLLVGLVVMFGCSFLTGVVYYIPYGVLGAMVILSVLAIIRWTDVIHYYKLKKKDAFIYLFSILLSLILGIDKGILVAVALSLASTLHRVSRPHVYALGHVEEGSMAGTWQPVNYFPNAKKLNGAIIMSFQGFMFFGNSDFLRYKLKKYEKKHVTGRMHTVVLVCNGVNRIDSSSLLNLEELAEAFNKRDVVLCFAELNKRVERNLARIGLVGDGEGTPMLFDTLEEAIEYARMRENRVHEDESKEEAILKSIEKQNAQDEL